MTLLSRPHESDGAENIYLLRKATHMAKKMLNPNTTIWVIDESLVTDIETIDASLINSSAENISCAIVRGYTLNPTDSDTDDSASICDSGNVENRLYDNYEGELTMFRDADIEDNLSVFNRAFQYFLEPDRRFWVIRRLGKKNTEAAVDGDQLEAFLFVNDRTRSIDGGDDGPVQFTVPLLQQGTYTGYFYLGGVSPIQGMVITSALPSGAAEGDTVTLVGTNFAGVTAVTVGGNPSTAFVVTGPTGITFEVPAGSAGSAPIIASSGAESSPPFAYTRGA